MKIGEKLRQIRKSQRKTLMDVEAGTGINNGNLSKIERNELGFSEETVAKLSNFYGVSIAELYSDVATAGFQVKIKELQSTDIATFSQNDVPDKTVINFDFIVPDKTSNTGYTSLLHEHMAVSVDMLRNLDVAPNKMVGVKASDDGMAGSINSSDQVLVDTTTTDVPSSGGVFAIVYGDDIVIRKIHKKPSGDLLLVCENKQYPEITATREEMQYIKIIGKVVYRSGIYR